jgi:hypothetical protein
VTMLGTGSLGVLDSRDRGKVLDRVRRGLARQFTGLMAQAVVAGFRIPNMRLIVHMPGGLASQARGVALRDRRRGRVGRRRVFRGGLTMGRMAFVGVLACLDRWNVLGRVQGGWLGNRGTDGPSRCCPGLHSPTAADRSHARGTPPRKPRASLPAIVVAGGSIVGECSAAALSLWSARLSSACKAAWVGDSRD